jgi:hypothetical protein
VKTLLTTLVLVAALSAPAFADENSVTFNQAPGEDGQVHIDIGVTYVFPGLPPRTGNFGLGTVRVTLPDSAMTLDPSQPADAGYVCFVAGSVVTCSNDGQPSSTGLTFPTSLTIHLFSPTCYAPADPTGAQADVWSAPGDPGSAPDVSLPITLEGACSDPGTDQGALNGHAAKCVVPKLAGSTIASAKRQVKNAHCSVGKITYAKSTKVKKNRVISQTLKPKKQLKQGTKVNFVVSKGP